MFYLKLKQKVKFLNSKENKQPCICDFSLDQPIRRL
jgi:hypothetical protein